MLYILTKFIILTQWTGYKELVIGADWYIYTKRMGNRSSNVELSFQGYLKALLRITILWELSFSFSITKILIWLGQFLSKKYSNKNIQRKSL